jgi:hypothetical protein
MVDVGDQYQRRDSGGGGAYTSAAGFPSEQFPPRRDLDPRGMSSYPPEQYQRREGPPSGYGAGYPREEQYSRGGGGPADYPMPPGSSYGNDARYREGQYQSPADFRPESNERGRYSPDDPSRRSSSSQYPPPGVADERANYYQGYTNSGNGGYTSDSSPRAGAERNPNYEAQRYGNSRGSDYPSSSTTPGERYQDGRMASSQYNGPESGRGGFDPSNSGPQRKYPGSAEEEESDEAKRSAAFASNFWDGIDGPVLPTNARQGNYFTITDEMGIVLDPREIREKADAAKRAAARANQSSEEFMANFWGDQGVSGSPSGPAQGGSTSYQESPRGRPSDRRQSSDLRNARDRFDMASAPEFSMPSLQQNRDSPIRGEAQGNPRESNEPPIDTEEARRAAMFASNFWDGLDGPVRPNARQEDAFTITDEMGRVLDPNELKAKAAEARRAVERANQSTEDFMAQFWGDGSSSSQGSSTDTSSRSNLPSAPGRLQAYQEGPPQQQRSRYEDPGNRQRGAYPESEFRAQQGGRPPFGDSSTIGRGNPADPPVNEEEARKSAMFASNFWDGLEGPVRPIQSHQDNPFTITDEMGRVMDPEDIRAKADAAKRSVMREKQSSDEFMAQFWGTNVSGGSPSPPRQSREDMSGYESRPPSGPQYERSGSARDDYERPRGSSNDSGSRYQEGRRPVTRGDFGASPNDGTDRPMNEEEARKSAEFASSFWDGLEGPVRSSNVRQEDLFTITDEMGRSVDPAARRAAEKTKQSAEEFMAKFWGDGAKSDDAPPVAARPATGIGSPYNDSRDEQPRSRNPIDFRGVDRPSIQSSLIGNANVSPGTKTRGPVNREDAKKAAAAEEARKAAEFAASFWGSADASIATSPQQGSSPKTTTNHVKKPGDQKKRAIYDSPFIQQAAPPEEFMAKFWGSADAGTDTFSASNTAAAYQTERAKKMPQLAPSNKKPSSIVQSNRSFNGRLPISVDSDDTIALGNYATKKVQQSDFATEFWGGIGDKVADRAGIGAASTGEKVSNLARAKSSWRPREHFIPAPSNGKDKVQTEEFLAKFWGNQDNTRESTDTFVAPKQKKRFEFVDNEETKELDEAFMQVAIALASME